MHDTGDRQFDYLDEAERQLIESVENDEWKPVDDVEAAKDMALRKAMTTLTDERRLQGSALEPSTRYESTASVWISHPRKVDQDALDALVADIKTMFNTNAPTRAITLKSFEDPSWIKLLAEAPWWTHALGAYAALYVAEIVKGAAKSTIQALSNRPNRLRVFSAVMSDFSKRHPERTSITIGLPVPDEVFGTVLTIRPESLSEIEHGIALFVHHLPKLMELIDSEELSDRAFRVVQLQLLGDGSMQVRWIDNSEFAEQKRTLRLRAD